MPLVSVILVSYNTRDLTLQSIEHVQQSHGFAPQDIEIIVVDNNSHDNTVQAIKQNFPEVKLIINQENVGFGGGNNQGARVAQGKYLLLLNTDAFVDPDSLRTLVDVMEQDKGVISAGPQLRYQDNSLQLSGGHYPTLPRVMAWMWWLDKLPLVKLLFPRAYHVVDRNWHTKAQAPDWLMGACVLLRRNEFLEVGGFDDKIFMYVEEVDLYQRLKSRFGKKVSFTPETQVIHLGGGSSAKQNAKRLILELRGVEYLYAKNQPHLTSLVRAIIILGIMLRIIVFSIIPGRKSDRDEYLRYFERAK